MIFRLDGGVGDPPQDLPRVLPPAYVTLCNSCTTTSGSGLAAVRQRRPRYTWMATAGEERPTLQA
jgi:hypothetical protein